MRIVADTNVVVSAFRWGGTPRRLLDAAHKRMIELYTSRVLIAELIVSGDDDLRTLGSYRGIAIVSPAECLLRWSA